MRERERERARMWENRDFLIDSECYQIIIYVTRALSIYIGKARVVTSGEYTYRFSLCQHIDLE